jgi:S1-C subfamily serine protease
VTARGLAVGCAAVLAASAIAHGTGGGARSGPGVVVVGEGAQVATGYVAAPGRVVTVAHAVPAGGVTVRDADGIARRATLIRRDEALDLALLSVPGLPPPGMPAAASGVRVPRGWLAAEVVRRADATVRAGDGRAIARRPVLELRADVRAGDSGAPVVDDGRVVGVVFARSRAREGVAWAVDATALAALLR